MFCPQCGTKVNDQATFCPRCGIALTGSPQQSSSATGDQVPPVTPAQDVPMANYTQMPTPDDKKAWKCARCGLISRLEKPRVLQSLGLLCLFFLGFICTYRAALASLSLSDEGSSTILLIGMRLCSYAAFLGAGLLSARMYRVMYERPCPRCGLTACQSIRTAAFGRVGILHAPVAKLEAVLERQAWYRKFREICRSLIEKWDPLFQRVDVPALLALACSIVIFSAYFIPVSGLDWVSGLLHVSTDQDYFYLSAGIYGLLGESIFENEFLASISSFFTLGGIAYTILPVSFAVSNMNPINRAKKIPLIWTRIHLVLSILLSLIASRDRMAMVSLFGEAELDLHGARFLSILFHILMLVCVRVSYEIDRHRHARLSVDTSTTDREELPV